jgi:uncharacterized membrane-anchored protein
MTKGVAIAVIHVLLVCSLAAKLVIDRKRYPRVWVKTTSYDPEHIVRGRYVALSLEVPTAGDFTPTSKELQDIREMGTKYSYIGTQFIYREARLEVREGKLFAVPAENGTRIPLNPNDQSKVIWPEPVQYYIPEHAEDPSRQPRGSALWAEVTIPKKGPPRPIQLAVSNASGWHVLTLR